MSINRLIIEAREKVLLNKNGQLDVLILFSSIFFALPMFIFSVYWLFIGSDLAIWPLDVLMGLLFLLSYCIALGAFNVNCSYKNSFFYVLHYFVKGKTERNKEVEAFLENYIPPVCVYVHKSNFFVDNEIFADLNRLNIHEWLRMNVSDVKSILNLSHQRCLEDDDKLDMNFVYWTQVVPFVENVDVYRTILLSSKVSRRKELDTEYISKKEITSAFRNYTIDNLFRFFTSPIDLQLYFETLIFYISQGEALPVKLSMSSLYKAYCLKKDGARFKEGSLKEGLYNGFRLEQIKDAHSLKNLSIDMINCLSSKKDKCILGQSFIYVLNKGENPYIAFELDRDGQLLEAKLKRNRSISRSEEKLIEEIINQ